VGVTNISVTVIGQIQHRRFTHLDEPDFDPVAWAREKVFSILESETNTYLSENNREQIIYFLII